MPPVFGPGVAVADALVVARRRERQRGLAVADRQQRQLVAVEELLDHDGRVAEPALDEHRLQRLPRLRLVGGDHDALAGGQPVGLDHRRVAGDRGHARRRPTSTTAYAAGRHARGGHHLLGERLRALQPRGRGARAEAGDARRARVGEPVDQRRLGADDDEVHAVGARSDPRRDDRRVARDPRVAGRAEHLGALRGALERAHDRVLAAAAADHEDRRVLRHSAAMKSSIGIAASDS